MGRQILVVVRQNLVDPQSLVVDILYIEIDFEILVDRHIVPDLLL